MPDETDQDPEQTPELVQRDVADGDEVPVEDAESQDPEPAG